LRWTHAWMLILFVPNDWLQSRVSEQVGRALVHWRSDQSRAA
jgi:hypothetical protein